MAEELGGWLGKKRRDGVGEKEKGWGSAWELHAETQREEGGCLGSTWCDWRRGGGPAGGKRAGIAETASGR
jgi:hypothetical protein